MTILDHAKEIPQANHSEAAWPIMAASPHALDHKVEGNPKAYTRKRKHPEEIDDPEPSD